MNGGSWNGSDFFGGSLEIGGLLAGERKLGFGSGGAVFHGRERGNTEAAGPLLGIKDSHGCEGRDRPMAR